MQVFKNTARRVLGPQMQNVAEEYQAILSRENLEFEVQEEPQVYASPTPSWIDLTIRYLAPVRQRRRSSTEIFVAIQLEMDKPEHKSKIISSYPTQIIMNRTPRLPPNSAN